MNTLIHHFKINIRINGVVCLGLGFASLVIASCKKEGNQAANNKENVENSLIAEVSANRPASHTKHKGQTMVDAPAKKLSFNRDIRPILSENCFACHGFDSHERKAGLRLDTSEGAYAALKDSPGKFVIVPGKPLESTALLRILTKDPEDIMPPKDFHREMTEEEKQTIKLWIEQGAEYENHWAYEKIAEPEFKPEEKVENPIDHYINATLAEKNAEISPEADKRTLLRRIALDLTGLPPTPSDINAFLADDSADAYEKQVDRLMAMPQYGERMAVPWLDVARFADTVAYHGDQNQNIFPYRDYVINAFNSNKPFDDFTREQLAGDLIENPTDEQLVATGFLRLSLMTREGGAQKDEYLAKYMGDRVRALGAAWLGQTYGCAECHDHKYDPIKAKDYYSLGAFFQDIKQWGVYQNYGFTPEPDLMGFSNDHPFPPELLFQSASQLRTLENLQKQYTKYASWTEGVTEEDKQQFQQFLKKHPTGWEPAQILLANGPQNGARVLNAKTVKFEGTQEKHEFVRVDFGNLQHRIAAIQVVVPATEWNKGFVGTGPGGSFELTKPGFNLHRADGQKQPLKLAWVQADRYKPEQYVNGRDLFKIDKIWRSGPERWIYPATSTREDHHLICHLETPVKLRPGDRIMMVTNVKNVGALRIQTTPILEAVPGQDALPEFAKHSFNKSGDKRNGQDNITVAGMVARSTTSASKLHPHAKALSDSIRKMRAGYARTLITVPVDEKEIPETRILPRGNWQDKSGEVVMPNTPSYLPKLEGVDGKKRLTRMDLVNWLMADNNPLVARHVVNRAWRQFFGQGLSGVLDDLGSQGEMPSHPELLDFLASSFRSNWDFKQLVKLIVMSKTYRQQAAQKTSIAGDDPYNRLLATQSARRLDAEFIRDNALSISGLLNNEVIGGSSVHPYQPAGYYVPLNFPVRRYANSTDNGQYRRGIYMHWQRTFVHPMLANFDAPSREECAADRLQSNSPLQALNLLNDPTFVEAANHFANRIYAGKKTDTERLDYAFELALSRKPTEQERVALMKLLERQKLHYQDKPEEVTKLLLTGNFKLHYLGYKQELVAWIQVCRVILNLHETITRF